MRVAVITGAAKGLGRETARQLSERGLRVILTGRNEADLAEAATGLETAEWHQLDVADAGSVVRFYDWLEGRHGRLDVLVNCAGRVYDGHVATLLTADPDVVLEAINNNAISALRMMQGALPMMERGGYGRIVNVSSGMGALADMGSRAVAYRTSKTALNALTRIAALEAPAVVKVNAVCPGWVRTDMGGPNASRDVASGASGIVWAATLPDAGPTGGFFRDGSEIAW